MTLYLKYRPQTLDELDSEKARETLKEIVLKGEIPHAFLFSGPKGIGKTSAARILAKIVNCENPKKGEPCNSCDQCTSIMRGENIDVVEIDAASHRGIDDVRAIRDAVKLAPARAKKKVYIIDEAHMLTVEASNALLKTLEEPPPHVIFILATTNPEKLIDTIRSRATNIPFKKATKGEIVRALKRVLKGEKVREDTKALELIAEKSEGSFRDAVKIVEELLVRDKDISYHKVEEYLFNKGLFNVDDFLGLLAERKTTKALSIIETAVNGGISAKNIATLLIERLRKALLSLFDLEGEELQDFTKDEIIQLIKLLSGVVPQIQSAVVEQIPLEVAVVEWCEKYAPNKNFDKNSNLTSKKNLRGENQKSDDLGKKLQPEKPSEENTLGEKNSLSNSSDSSNSFKAIGELWEKVLAEIHPANISTEALLRASKPVSFDGKVLTLSVYYKFHKERLEESPHRDVLENVVEKIVGQKIRVKCLLTQPPFNVKQKESSLSQEKKDNDDVVLTESEDEDIVKIAKEIFGG